MDRDTRFSRRTNARDTSDNGAYPPVASSSRNGRPTTTALHSARNQQATRSQPPPIEYSLTLEQRELIQDVFQAHDPKLRGFVQVSQLPEILQNLQIRRPGKSTLNMWVNQVDPQGSGKFSQDELMDFVQQRYGEMMGSSVEFENAFRLFKPDIGPEANSARITVEDLKRISAHLGEHIPDEELREMVSLADTTNTGGVGLDDFVRIMQKTGLF
ncbi:hypothetical protein BX661DRAFT_176770 [Kickxella alabastrina]|uniref:uncharacterized protein n=1 Tax=Kickxella alabastrina TaxID=61397 RepID=UPI0022205482|nr:uncharacterized protein BX661DRAFT_176770 [Kickxella alabastrina]KAI7834191.1 hypothetical protein BX661DRAFT_176770 [Kickxella alabastrina]KAJ1935668.1 hypothetical protein GGF37_005909 [Kickxella alabastrina]